MSMAFLFEKSTCRRLREVLIAVPMVIAVMASGASCMVYGQTDPIAMFFGKCLLALTLVVMVIFSIWALALRNSGGRWLIRISDDSVSWEAPEGIGETSFEVRLEDIDQVVCERWGSIETEDHYFLSARQGRYPLDHASSGVNIHEFIRVLRSKGIAYEQVSASS